MKNEIAILEKFVKHPPFGRSPGGTGCNQGVGWFGGNVTELSLLKEYWDEFQRKTEIIRVV
jgi:hypothetical protein